MAPPPTTWWRTRTRRCIAPSNAAATTCSVSNPAWIRDTRERVKLESDLHGALANRQFELHYQPKVDTATDYFHSAEALIRWRHPERGIVMPEEFIPLAEDCGLINAIGEWVLREACRQCRPGNAKGCRCCASR